MKIQILLRKIKSAPRAFRIVWYWYLNKIARFAVFPSLLNVLGIKHFRAFLWKKTGCNIGKNVSIGWDVYYDVGNTKLITIEDDVWIGPGVTILNTLHPPCPKFKECAKGVIIKRGAKIGGNVTLGPKVKVGEGVLPFDTSFQLLIRE